MPSKGFKKGHWTSGGPDSLEAMRRRALQRQVPLDIGPRTVAEVSYSRYAQLALGGAASVGLGFLIGRWWARRPKTTVRGMEPNAYLHGMDVLIASGLP